MTLSTHTKKHLWLQTLLTLLLSISLLTGCAAPAAPAPSELRFTTLWQIHPHTASPTIPEIWGLFLLRT